MTHGAPPFKPGRLWPLPLWLTLGCLLAAGSTALARSRPAPDPQPEALLLTQAQHWYQQQRPDLARQALNKALALQPVLPQAWLWQGLLELKFGDPAIARLWLDRLLAHDPQGSASRQLAQALQGPDQRPPSQALASAAATASPARSDSASIRPGKTRISTADHRRPNSGQQQPLAWTELPLRLALSSSTSLPALPQDAPQDMPSDAARASPAAPSAASSPRLPASREPSPSKTLTLHSAVDVSTKPGTAGSSQFHAVEIPLVLQLSQGQVHWRLHADRIALSAGMVDASRLADASVFGQIATRGPAPGALGLQQAYGGHLLALSYEIPNWRLDMGHLPADFPVSGWVGGARWSGQWAGNDLRVDLARRPQTGSVLSYGGAVDPVSGQSWGGVKREGVNVFVYRELDPIRTLMLDTTLARLRGQAVPQNREFNLRASYDQQIHRGPWGRWEAGGSYTYWTFANNQRFYTFGHGGYYSPQQYQALNARLDWRGQHEGWLWQLRGALGASRSREDSTPYFPGRPDLQQAASAYMASQQLGSPVYTGGSGGGPSRGLTAQIEHNPNRFWQYGLSLQIDRSEYYAPNRLQAYLRWSPDGDLKPGYGPNPVRPYSRY